MENTNGRNKERDLLLTNKSRIVPCGTEKMPQRIKRHKRTTLHWSEHPQREQDESEKSGYGLKYKKAYDMVPQSWIINCVKIYKISDEVINFIKKTMKTWRVELTEGVKKLSWREDPEWYIPRRYTITITIYNCNDGDIGSRHHQTRGDERKN